jgi:cytokinin dehydrogenase
VNLLRDLGSRRAASEDFGRLARGDAWGVALPRDIDELCATIAFASERGLVITVRGRGYSQSGQSLPAGGLSLDCTHLNRIGPIDPESPSVRCEGGARLRDVVMATAERGFLPPVLPLNLDMTIGGLLSAGGIGSTSHHHGPVVANVLDIEIVTAVGERVRCSSSQNAGLFHAVLSGAGRCAVIASAHLALRRFQPRTQTYHLLYSSIGDWLDDQRRLSRSALADHLEGGGSAAVPAGSAVRSGGLCHNRTVGPGEDQFSSPVPAVQGWNPVARPTGRHLRNA